MPFTKRDAPEHGEKRHAPARWPTEPATAARLELVARYARLGYGADAILRVIQKSMPPPWVEIKQIRKDIKQVLEIWRTNALEDAEIIFGEVDEHLRHLSAESLKLYYETANPRYEAHELRLVDETDPQTGQVVRVEKRITPDGREAQLLPAATPGERTAMLTAAQRIATARSMHHFGSKGGATVTFIQQNNQLNADRAVVVTGGPGMALRDQASRVRELMQEERHGKRAPRLALPTGAGQTEPRTSSLGDAGDSPTIVDGEAREIDWNDELEAVARSRGAQGRMDALGDLEELDDAGH